MKPVAGAQSMEGAAKQQLGFSVGLLPAPEVPALVGADPRFHEGEA